MPSEENKQTEAKKPAETADIEKEALENATVAAQMEAVKKDDRLAENPNAENFAQTDIDTPDTEVLE